MQTAAVVVLYHPSIRVSENIASYASGSDAVFVFDNTADPHPDVLDGLKRVGGLEYFPLGSNRGVAYALNAGAERAIERGCKYLLTMDQDSAAPDDLVSTLVSIAESDPSIGVAGPFHVDRCAPDALPEADLEDVVTLMTSGSLVNLEAYRRSGGFREDFFIDYVDDEYCLRLRRNGYRVVRANRVILEHAQGQKTEKNFFGRTVHPTHHAPERFYYQSRNRVYLRREYGERFPRYFAYEKKLHAGRLVKMLLYERQRLRKILMTIRGMRAARRGEGGPIGGR